MNKKNETKLKSYLVLGVAVAFISYGIFRGETLTVLAKAIKICLECVGIG
ncbi:MAG: CD1871A family CXXC motif-containing protein [Eubacteriales bacterium]|nr:CD1871A family CXXC motif-containing protein [Eubacteriales bacterium]MDY3333285.1 CD1871A family CXXC motif-containing protein [Gallibacter sp.]